MISTATISAALQAAILATGLFDKAVTHPISDLAGAMETARTSGDAMAVVVAGPDEWTHVVDEEDNTPIRSECRNTFEVLVTARDLRHGTDGVPNATELKDALHEALLWDDLGNSELVCLPQGAEPIVIEKDGSRGREAWKMTFEIRQQILPS